MYQIKRDCVSSTCTCISQHEEGRWKTVRTQQKLWKYMYPNNWCRMVSIQFKSALKIWPFKLPTCSLANAGKMFFTARMLRFSLKCAWSPIWQNWETLGKHARASLWMLLETWLFSHVAEVLLKLTLYWNWCT